MTTYTIIINSVSNIANLFVSRWINTGDRIVDNSIVALVCSCIGIILGLLPIWVENIRNYIEVMMEFQFDPKQVSKSKDLKKMVLEMHYSFPIRSEGLYNALQFNISQDSYLRATQCIERWISTTYGYCGGHVHQTTLYWVYGNQLTPGFESNNSSFVYPIHRYRLPNTYAYEYVLYDGNKFYSNNKDEMFRIITKIFKLNVTDEQPTTEKYIYELNNQGTLVKKRPINKAKTFDKIHFDCKADILAIMDKFKNGSMYPPCLSLDNKLGVLLHGTYGTGKTGVCMAAANELNRDILLLDGLMTLPQSVVLDVVEKCKSTHVIVLDEFDYILQRGTADNDMMEAMKQQLLDAKTTDETEKIKKRMMEMKMSSDEFLLKLLDGFGDGTGRCIFASTNNPEKIHPKFKRPGRFDVVAHLGHCSFAMFRDIVSPIHGLDCIQMQEPFIRKILERQITPLVLINCMIRTNTFNEMMQMLQTVGDNDTFIQTLNMNFDESNGTHDQCHYQENNETDSNNTSDTEFM